MVVLLTLLNVDEVSPIRNKVTDDAEVTCRPAISKHHKTMTRPFVDISQSQQSAE